MVQVDMLRIAAIITLRIQSASLRPMMCWIVGLIRTDADIGNSCI